MNISKDEISKKVSEIVGSFDHDLSEEEEKFVRETLTNPEIFTGLQQLASSKSIDAKLEKKVKQKINNVTKQNPEIHSVFQIIDHNIGKDLRKNAFYEFITNHSETQIMELASQILVNHPNNAVERWRAIQSAFGFMRMDIQELIVKVSNLLNRKHEPRDIKIKKIVGRMFTDEQLVELWASHKFQSFLVGYLNLEEFYSFLTKTYEKYTRNKIWAI